MQQMCRTCGAPITAGMTACARCGTPVSNGSGAYDPTVRVGTPPGSAYGSQPYGPPPTDPYGAPPPPPPGFGAQPAGYGAPPPPPPGFGAPPQPGFGAPGFGAPPQPGFGPGQPPFMAPPPQKRSNTWIYIVGGILAVILILCVGGFLVVRALATNAVNSLATTVATNTTFTQTSTTGPHITSIATGTGFDTSTGQVQGQSATFKTSDTIWVVYTVTNPDPGASVTLTLNPGGQSTSSPPLDTQTNEYGNSLTVSGPGIYTIEIDYNGTPEATIDFQVTS
jgi:hypothetical protein